MSACQDILLTRETHINAQNAIAIAYIVKAQLLIAHNVPWGIMLILQHHTHAQLAHMDVFLAMQVDIALIVYHKCIKQQIAVVLASFVHSHVQAAKMRLIAKHVLIITSLMHQITNAIDVKTTATLATLQFTV